MPRVACGFVSVVIAFLAGCAGHQSAKVAAPIDRTAIVPILMYHHVQELSPGTDEVTRTWTVSPKEFTAQMKYLAENGYHAVTFDQLTNHLTNSSPLQDKPIMITFDDGWDVGYSTVFPILKDLHLSGTFFVCPPSIGEGPGNGYMTWPQLREMISAGMDVQAHTMSHPHLRDILPDAQYREIVESKRILEAKLGRPIVAVAYPYGQFSEGVIQIVKDAGYRCALTIEPGLRQRESELFSLHRTRISYGDTLDTFRELVSWP